MQPTIEQVITAAGGQSKLARRIGVTPQAVQQWRRVPPTRVLEVEQITGISRHDLRPDIYGPPVKGKAA